MKIFLKTGSVIVTNEVRFTHNGAEAYVTCLDKEFNAPHSFNTSHVEKIVGGKDTTGTRKR
jgi:hypothetical protein